VPDDRHARFLLESVGPMRALFPPAARSHRCCPAIGQLWPTARPVGGLAPSEAGSRQTHLRDPVPKQEGSPRSTGRSPSRRAGFHGVARFQTQRRRPLSEGQRWGASHRLMPITPRGTHTSSTAFIRGTYCAKRLPMGSRRTLDVIESRGHGVDRLSSRRSRFEQGRSVLPVRQPLAYDRVAAKIRGVGSQTQQLAEGARILGSWERAQAPPAAPRARTARWLHEIPHCCLVR